MPLLPPAAEAAREAACLLAFRLSIFAYAELHCQPHIPEISRASDELNGDAEDKNAPGEAHARRLGSIVGLFTASHTFDGLDHFFAPPFFPGAVKLTSPEGVVNGICWPN